ncbi:flagellar hook-length control protein FliK [Pseudodesulfovibrio thermohalotolerans]|uniref:flagellar hook-length control protein FliK n=1 Tax=Pseudodesulfovibrio thermohalotolerans TaxID=2880651 RepID=UPI002441FB33|nr:flagellar hook-length control protein FliK [Pseudodesulfovibrio thermohalotolerans]WFS62126.1 flagellar hook-length control protein FliK [Pseudodesulfovibrio thermohalotolerans]
MQNIPGIAKEAASTASVQLVKMATSGKNTAQTATADAKDEKRALFAELFTEHTERVESELSLAPVTHREKMLDSTPGAEKEEEGNTAIDAAGVGTSETTPDINETADEAGLDSRMTMDDLDAVRDDLKEYGMSEEEIAAIEEQVESEEGMTWGQFVSTVAEKLAESRKGEMTDEQKVSLAGFFNKLGFTEKDSSKLVDQLEKGQFDKVLKQVEARLDAMPQDQQLLFTKDEVEAFVSAMGLSREFVTRFQELFASNTLPKDVKQAFTRIRQELAGLDLKDQKLVKAVGKAFAAVMGDKHKESSAAAQVNEAVDLKPRVAEDKADTTVREELAQAFRNRKDAPSDNTVRRQDHAAADGRADVKPDAVVPGEAGEQDMDPEAEHDRKWNNFFDRVREDGSAKTDAARNAEAVGTEAKAVTIQQSATGTNARAWEKVSAPKVLKQVDQAIIKTLKNGARQLTLQLTPENLGKLSIVLSVQGKEVSATIRAENSDSHKVITDNLNIIKNSLEAQGLKVEKLDVQTGLADNQSFNGWFGESQHNLSREREVMIAMRSHMRTMREQNTGGVAQDVQSVGERVIPSDQGLHLIA